MKGQKTKDPGVRILPPQGFLKKMIPVTLACSILLSSMPAAFSAPGDVNSTNDGRDVQGGTYFNTPGSRTTFENTGSGGLWVRSGVLVRGLESDINKVPTGNGGTLYFRAPGNVVRIDGDIDVSAIKNGSMYLGNGGKVFIDSAYLYQTGNIYANGFNGGLIQFNVGAATIAPGAKIMAEGFGGNGGSVTINSPGTVDIQRSAIIDTSGKVIGTIDTNVISIEGSVVNNEGIIRANGVAIADERSASSLSGDASLMAANPSLAGKPAPGPISGGTGQGIIMGAPADFQPVGPTTERGGTIRLVATGQNYSTTAIVNNADSGVLTADDKTMLNNRNVALLRNEGDIMNVGTVQAKGGVSSNGGTIMLTASDDVMNFGSIDVKGGNGVSTATNGTNGGNGGAVMVAAKDAIVNHGFIEATGGNGGNAASVNISTGNGQNAVADASGNVAGRGGNGGAIAFSYNTMENRGAIIASGGVGGVGGNANAFDSEVSATNNADATASATAIGGAGGLGGDGGLIVFSGNSNPTNTSGLVQAHGGRGGRGGNVSADARVVARGTGDGTAITNTTAGAGGLGGKVGTVVAPNAAQFPFDQTYRAAQGGPGNSGTQQRTRIITENGSTKVEGEFISAIGGATAIGNHNQVEATRKNELIVHGENAFLLSQGGGAGVVSNTLSGRLNDAQVRTVTNPLGTSGAGGVGLQNAKFAVNFVIASSNPNSLNLDFANDNANPIFGKLNTLTILNNGNITNGMHWAPGVQQVGPGFHDISFSVAGGHHSWLSSGTITNNGSILTRGLWSGGSINLAADQDIVNNKVIFDIAFNKHTSSGFTITPGYISSHAGSTILKAKRDITNNWMINNKEAFFDIHPGLDANPRPEWVRFMNAAQIGHTNFLLAGNNITNNANGRISSDALTYRDGTVDQGANNPANAIGGIMTLNAGGTLSNSGLISADATSWFSNNGNFKFRTLTGLTEVTSTDGVIIEE